MRLTRPPGRSRSPWQALRPAVPPGRERHILRLGLYAAAGLAAVAASGYVATGRGLPPGVLPELLAAVVAAAAALALVELRADETVAQCVLAVALGAALVAASHLPGIAVIAFAIAGLALHPLGSLALIVVQLGAGLAGPGQRTADFGLRASDMPALVAPISALLTGMLIETLLARLRRAHLELRLLQAAQARMVDTIGHEVRTPLTEIKVLTDLLVRVLPLGPPLEQLQRMTPLLQDMRRHCDELAGVVERAQWYQRLAAQPAVLGTAQTDVTALLRELAAEHGPRAEARRIRLEVEAPLRLVAPVNARALRRAVECVLDNALKFSPEGGYARLGCARRRGRAEIWIDDDGPGIRAEDLPFVCEPFFHREYVIDASDSQRGIGLGLPIARQIVEAHAGELRIDSAPGRGTRVCLSLPLDGARCEVRGAESDAR